MTNEGTALLRAITAFTAMYTNRPQNNVQEQLDLMSAAELRELATNCGALKVEARKTERAKERQRGVYPEPANDYPGMDEAAFRGDTLGGAAEHEALVAQYDDDGDAA